MRIANPSRPVIDGKMQCRDCHEWLKLTHFYLGRRKRNDVLYYDSYCADCKLARTQATRATNRAYKQYLQARLWKEERPTLSKGRPLQAIRSKSIDLS